MAPASLDPGEQFLHVTQPPKPLLAEAGGWSSRWLTALSHWGTPTPYCRILGMTEHLGKTRLMCQDVTECSVGLDLFPIFSILGG